MWYASYPRSLLIRLTQASVRIPGQSRRVADRLRGPLARRRTDGKGGYPGDILRQLSLSVLYRNPTHSSQGAYFYKISGRTPPPNLRFKPVN